VVADKELSGDPPAVVQLRLLASSVTPLGASSVSVKPSCEPPYDCEPDTVTVRVTGLMVRLIVPVPKSPLLSDSWTVKVYFPACVGVPVMSPHRAIALEATAMW
jgi:hypothetical protein